MLYSNTLNITVTLYLCNYCQYSSAAHCTLSVHSIICTVTHPILQSLCLSVITSVQFSCTLYTICTLNMLYSNTLNITVTLSLCNYCQYSSAAHCTQSAQSICCTVTYSILQSICLSVTQNTNNIHSPCHCLGQFGKESNKNESFVSFIHFFPSIFM